jgi:hypothetical protein
LALTTCTIALRGAVSWVGFVLFWVFDLGV